MRRFFYAPMRPTKTNEKLQALCALHYSRRHFLPAIKGISFGTTVSKCRNYETHSNEPI